MTFMGEKYRDEKESVWKQEGFKVYLNKEGK